MLSLTTTTFIAFLREVLATIINGTKVTLASDEESKNLSKLIRLIKDSKVDEKLREKKIRKKINFKCSVPYKVKINRAENFVMIYGVDIHGKYKIPYKCFVCSSAKNIKNTLLGKYRLNDRYRWHSMVDGSYAQYAIRFYDKLMLHSVPYYKKSKESINRPTKILPVDYVKDGLYANTELNDSIFDHKVFNNPKPSTLVSFLVNFVDSSNAKVLDFFAGSGTTLHATMQLNAEDGGHRQCILVTNNENGICENVTYERNKRVIEGYTTPKGAKVEGLKQNTLRYYKTDYISRDRTQKNMRALVAAATDLLCIKEDLYEELTNFGRLKLRPQLARYFDNGRKHMLIVYREELIDELVEEIRSLPPAPAQERGKLKVYVFSPGRYPFTDNFREVEDKVELVALPAAIYDAYQKVLPKRREKLFAEEEKRKETTIPTRDD